MAGIDLDALFAFAALARLGNMRRAAELLHMTQPPLSRKIQRLEAALGIVLFERHSRGMELTAKGRQVLGLIAPLLDQAKATRKGLAALAAETKKISALGLSTAFEQSVFAPWLLLWEEIWEKPAIVRKDSPALVRDLRRHRLDAAFIALPADAGDLILRDTGYSEACIAALPQNWPEAGQRQITLENMAARPLFWFRRARNPLFYDHMLWIFGRRNFAPPMLEEPPEHDVLLARIAFGEGWALLPRSFGQIKREGVQFLPLSDRDLVISLGFVCGDPNLAERLFRPRDPEDVRGRAPFCDPRD